MTRRWEIGGSTLGAPGESLADVVATLTDAGATQVELRAAPDALISVRTPAEARVEVREAFERAHLNVLAVASGVRVGDIGSDEALDEALEDHLHLAADLGADFVRVFPGLPAVDGPFDRVPDAVGNRPAMEAIAAARLARAAPMARALGVQIALETHDSHPRGADLRRILDREGLAATVGVGVIWDLLHPWRVGEDPAVTWSALSTFLLGGRGYVQIKDVASRQMLTPVLQGSGRVPLQDAVRLLDKGGYEGPLSLEWERTWYPEVARLASALPAAVSAVRALE